jgi:hypothetical protein
LFSSEAFVSALSAFFASSEASALSHDKTQIVRILKKMVPEFISNNSIFEKLDR